jgi:site-specific DNA-methyltransferase (adenine-specific)
MDAGRWPANLVTDEEAGRLLDEQSGELGPGAFPARVTRNRSHGVLSNYTDEERPERLTTDYGGASRFFYTAKASRADRGEGNTHPTVKPSDLMKWLCTLTATPTGGTVLDPFMGSGTTLYAAKETGRKAVGIELDEKWCEIAAKRCSQGVLDFG